MENAHELELILKTWSAFDFAYVESAYVFDISCVANVCNLTSQLTVFIRCNKVLPSDHLVILA